MTKRNNYYWWIIILLLGATSLSFLDRQVLSMTIIKIKEDLLISDVEYGFINSGFLVSYAIMFTLGGFLIDKYGSRLGLAISVGFWSFSTILHSLAGSVFHFSVFRFMLGVGEGGCFPGAIKAVLEWVPKKRHALANGIAIGGAALGAVLAPPLCVYFLGFWGWRTVFVITGLFGFVWLIIWLLSTGKKASNYSSTFTDEFTQTEKKPSFMEVVKDKKVRIFVLIRFLLDPIFYFYMFWIPKYLSDGHGLSIEKIGQILWMPFLALGIANIIGGWASDVIFKKTSKLRLSRQLVMGGAALLTVPIAFIGLVDSYVWILVMMGIAFFAHGLWITNYITSIGDVFGQHASSTVVGLSGSAGAISSLVLNPVIGYVISTYSYSSLWIYSGLMYPLAFAFFVLFMSSNKYKVQVQ